MSESVLFGITFTGASKNYMTGKFIEMLNNCVRPVEGVDIAWSTDRSKDWFREDEDDIFLPMTHPSEYCEDIVMIAREDQRKYAYENGYDKLVWAGVDALYQSQDDFKKLISHDLDAVGALTCARSKSEQAVAGLFIRDQNGLTDEHTLFSPWALEHGWVIEADIPGADALVMKRNCLDISWVGKHTPWYERVAQGQTDLTCEGWYLLELLKRGQKIYLDTSIKMWHCHEDLIARQFKGIEKPLSEVSW